MISLTQTITEKASNARSRWFNWPASRCDIAAESESKHIVIATPLLAAALNGYPAVTRNRRLLRWPTARDRLHRPSTFFVVIKELRKEMDLLSLAKIWLCRCGGDPRLNIRNRCKIAGDTLCGSFESRPRFMMRQR